VARGLTSALKAELAKAQLALAFFVEIEVSSATIRVWSGVGSKTWNAQTWTGVGEFGGVSPIAEETDAVATGIVLSLSGIPANLIGYALDEIRHGKKATVWLAALDSAGAVIADPYASFSGWVDTCDIEESAETATIQVSVESELLRLQIPNERRFTHADQILDYASDKGFEYMTELQEKNLVWGAGAALPSSSPAPPSGGSGVDWPHGGYY